MSIYSIYSIFILNVLLFRTSFCNLKFVKSFLLLTFKLSFINSPSSVLQFDLQVCFVEMSISFLIKMFCIA